MNYNWLVVFFVLKVIVAQKQIVNSIGISTVYQVRIPQQGKNRERSLF
jgi:hypothetical protein